VRSFSFEVQKTKKTAEFVLSIPFHEHTADTAFNSANAKGGKIRVQVFATLSLYIHTQIRTVILQREKNQRRFKSKRSAIIKSKQLLTLDSFLFIITQTSSSCQLHAARERNGSPHACVANTAHRRAFFQYEPKRAMISSATFRDHSGSFFRRHRPTFACKYSEKTFCRTGYGLWAIFRFQSRTLFDCLVTILVLDDN
jgi:hypothetical protein